MQHHHRARGRDLVQLLHRHARGAEVDGVEPPGKQRLVGVGELGLGFAQARDQGFEALQAGPQAAVRAAPVVIAGVDEIPHAAFEQVGVAFDQPGHQHLVGKAGVERGRAPALQLLGAAHAEDAAFAHGHMGRFGLHGVHGDDFPGLKNRRRRVCHGGTCGCL
ncbi:hypothetical protein D3C80_1396260 [compost metagenome]